MKLWPYETYEVDIPRAPSEVLAALSAYIGGQRGGDPIEYAPLDGHVSGTDFVVWSSDRSYRSPKFNFYGQVQPNGDGSRVQVTLKSQYFPWFLGGSAIIGVVLGIFLAHRTDINAGFWGGIGVAPVLVFYVYLIHIIYFWLNQRHKRDLVGVMSVYGKQADLQSID